MRCQEVLRQTPSEPENVRQFTAGKGLAGSWDRLEPGKSTFCQGLGILETAKHNVKHAAHDRLFLAVLFYHPLLGAARGTSVVLPHEPKSDLPRGPVVGCSGFFIGTWSFVVRRTGLLRVPMSIDQ